MVLYVGYPISYETACELFGMSAETTNIQNTIQTFGLKLYLVDKGQYILGLAVEQVADLWDSFVSVDDALICILQQKKKVVQLLQDAGVDLSDFLLERMEGEPLRVHNPQPYLITTNGFW